MTATLARDNFLDMVSELAAKPFPQRYLAYRRSRPSPYEAPPLGRISNDENLALILVMSENFPLFGVKRMGSILRWPNIQVHHILQRGITNGHVARVSDTMYQGRNGRELLSRLRDTR